MANPDWVRKFFLTGKMVLVYFLLFLTTRQDRPAVASESATEPALSPSGTRSLSWLNKMYGGERASRLDKYGWSLRPAPTKSRNLTPAFYIPARSFVLLMIRRAARNSSDGNRAAIACQSNLLRQLPQSLPAVLHVRKKSSPRAMMHRCPRQTTACYPSLSAPAILLP